MTRDIYTGKNVGAMGPNATASNTTFNPKASADISEIDLKALAAELARLRPEMRRRAVEPEHDEAIAAMGKAELAATKGDTAGSLRYLRSAGSWAARVATELSAAIVAKLIESKLGG